MSFPLPATKIFGTFLLFIFTLVMTLLPSRLQNFQDKTLRSINCFVGGLFLGLSFLHLLPDSLHEFQNVPSLIDIQKVYPMAEFSVCVGMIIVMTVEKFADVLQEKKRKNECDSSSDCCINTCRKTDKVDVNEKTALLNNSYNKSSYSTTDDSVTLLHEPETYSGSVDVEKFHETTLDEVVEIKKCYSEKLDDEKSIQGSAASKKGAMERRKQQMRTFCLVIALMIHSLFEGMTLALQKTTLGFVTLAALLLFHKSIVGFSLGIRIVSSKREFLYHLKQSVLFAVALPVGAAFGLIILSAKLNLFNAEAVAVITSVSSGTFIYITFFEILAKYLGGNSVRDLCNFAWFLLGFSLFAGLTCIRQLQV